MKRDTAHTVAFIGVMTALMFVLLTLETYVFIYFIKPSPAFLSIPLFIALSMYADAKNSWIGGTVFGACSFALSFIVGYTPFYNPLVSVLPRAIAGAAGFFIYRGLLKAFKSDCKTGVKHKVICGAAAGITVILHTVLVLGAMQIFSTGGAFFYTVWQTILGVNFLAEFACAVVLVPVFVPLMQKIAHTGAREAKPTEEKRRAERADENTTRQNAESATERNSGGKEEKQ